MAQLDKKQLKSHATIPLHNYIIFLSQCQFCYSFSYIAKDYRVIS